MYLLSSPNQSLVKNFTRR